MTDLSEILRAHSARYPLMMPCDAVKLIYQNEFGGGHIVENEKASLSYLLLQLQLIAVILVESIRIQHQVIYCISITCIIAYKCIISYSI